MQLQINFYQRICNFSHIIFATHEFKPNEIEGIMTAIVLTPTKEDLGLITPAMILTFLLFL